MMANVPHATEADSVVINVTDTAIETVPVAMMANAALVTASRFVRPAAATERSVMIARTNVLPAVPRVNNRQVRTSLRPETTVINLRPETTVIPLRSSLMQIAIHATAEDCVHTAMASLYAKIVF